MIRFRIILPLFPFIGASCMMSDMASRKNISPSERAASSVTSVIGAPYEVAYGALSGVEQVVNGESNPTFYFDKNKRLPAYLESDEMELAENMLKQGASPHFKIGDKSAVYHYAYMKERNKADMLVRYGGKKSDIAKAEAQRKSDDIKAIAEAKERGQRQKAALDAFGRFMQKAMADSATAGSGVPEAEQKGPQNNELSRFQNTFKGTRTTFTLVEAGDGPMMSLSNHLLLRHSSGKTFSVQYGTGLGAGLSGERGLQPGERIEVHFNAQGTPTSAKNLSNDRVVPLTNYKVTGYGW